MGLDIPKSDREVFEAELARLSVAARGETGDSCGPTDISEAGGRPDRIVRVIFDAPPFIRRYAPTRTPVTAYALARKMTDYAFGLISDEFLWGCPNGVVPEVYVCFDTQENMPAAREVVARRRNPPATPEAIQRARLDPGNRKVLINGRLFAPEERPLTDDEISALDDQTPFMFVRAMASRAGKEALWALIETAVVRILAEETRAARCCRVVIDGPRTGPAPAPGPTATAAAARGGGRSVRARERIARRRETFPERRWLWQRGCDGGVRRGHATGTC